MNHVLVCTCVAHRQHQGSRRPRRAPLSGPGCRASSATGIR